ncbi:MAG: hypothetical protein R2789_15050 [Microthrixaceae bacterium]
MVTGSRLAGKLDPDKSLRTFAALLVAVAVYTGIRPSSGSPDRTPLLHPPALRPHWRPSRPGCVAVSGSRTHQGHPHVAAPRSRPSHDHDPRS